MGIFTIKRQQHTGLERHEAVQKLKDLDLVNLQFGIVSTSSLISSFLSLSLTAVCFTLPGKLRHVRPCGAAASKTKLSKAWERKEGSKGR
ncbi:hypothetical protein Q8A67_013667 [Cirrhinus molitorella]|uniref:Uncharacterized protein n=1 Tax=Cirrhinus molitorella TaxID=172907 RepID=A0AA88TJA3_9TELE|nr:hypothetical protein Q8A67_013667 [Cirrhinus molitorella]